MAMHLNIFDYLLAAKIAIKLQILLQNYTKRVTNQRWLEQQRLIKKISGGITVL